MLMGSSRRLFSAPMILTPKGDGLGHHRCAWISSNEIPCTRSWALQPPLLG